MRRLKVYCILMLYLCTCKRISNKAPNPPVINALNEAGVNQNVIFSAYSIDPEGDKVSIRFDFGDGVVSSWSDYVSSGEAVSMSHFYNSPGTYYVKAQAKDEKGKMSEWSDAHPIEISESYTLETWEKTLEKGWGVCGLQIGSSYIIGVITADDNKYKILKLDLKGNKLWEKTYDFYGWRMIYSQDEEIVIAGGKEDGNYWIIGLDTSGNKIWEWQIGTAYEWGVFINLSQCWDGDFVFTGADDDPDVLVARINKNTGIIWKKVYRYSESDWDGGLTVIQSSPDELLLLIDTNAELYYEYGGYVVLKLDYNTGDSLWSKVVAINLYPGWHGIQTGFMRKINNEYFVVGWRESEEKSYAQDTCVLIKYDENFNKLFEKYYIGIPRDMVETFDGCYLIGGGVKARIDTIQKRQ